MDQRDSAGGSFYDFNPDYANVQKNVVEISQIGSKPKMITIIFEAHATSLDNEAHKASGWNDVALSALEKI